MPRLPRPTWPYRAWSAWSTPEPHATPGVATRVHPMPAHPAISSTFGTPHLIAESYRLTRRWLAEARPAVTAAA
jgi:hypothetical protein